MIRENLDPTQLQAITESRLSASATARTALPEGMLSDEDLDKVAGGAHLNSHEFYVMDCSCGWLSPVYDKTDFHATKMAFLALHAKHVAAHGLTCTGNYAEYGPYFF